MIEIRNAQFEDAANLVAIYAPYVEKTAITFETQVPTVEDFENSIHLFNELDTNILLVISVLWVFSIFVVFFFIKQKYEKSVTRR